MEPQTQSLLQILSECVDACEHCATACLQEDNVQMMARCILLDRDCADVCALTYRFVARGSEHAQHLMRECAEICHACVEECAKHEADHCQACAEVCRRCADACRQGLSA